MLDTRRGSGSDQGGCFCLGSKRSAETKKLSCLGPRSLGPRLRPRVPSRDSSIDLSYEESQEKPGRSISFESALSTRSVRLIAHLPQIISHTNIFLWYLMYRSSQGASCPTQTRQSRPRTRATVQAVLVLHHRPQTTQNQAHLVPVPTSSTSSTLRTQIRPRPLSVGPLLLAVQAWDLARKTEDTETRRGLFLLLSLSAQRCHRIPSRIQDRSTNLAIPILRHRALLQLLTIGYGLHQKTLFQ
jgi:hypothetical protein